MALRAERRHDWEKRLTEAQEEKLLSAIAAYKKSGHDLDLYHEGGKLDVYEPPMTASLYALTDAFLKGTEVATFLEGSAGVLGYSREPNVCEMNAGCARTRALRGCALLLRLRKTSVTAASASTGMTNVQRTLSLRPCTSSSLQHHIRAGAARSYCGSDHRRGLRDS